MDILFTAAAICLIAGLILIALGVLIFFKTDCYEVLNELRTTQRLDDETRSSSEDDAARDIYYGAQVEKIVQKNIASKPKFKKDEGFDPVIETEAEIVRPKKMETPLTKKPSETEKKIQVRERIGENTEPLKTVGDPMNETAALSEKKSADTAPLGGEVLSSVESEDTSPLTAGRSKHIVKDTAPLFEGRINESDVKASLKDAEIIVFGPDTEALLINQKDTGKERDDTAPLTSEDENNTAPLQN